MNKNNFIFIVLLIYFMFPYHAYSYVGPGMGGGAIMAALGIVFSILVLLFGLLWFPIKRLLLKNNKNKNNKNNDINSY